MDDDQETTELQSMIEVIPDKEEVAVDAIPLATKLLSIVDWKIIKEGKIVYYQIIRADGISNRRYGLGLILYMAPCAIKGVLRCVKEPVCPSVSKVNNTENSRKLTMKYAEMYKSQRPRGNQRNWNNQKSQQLGSDFVMIKKAVLQWMGKFCNTAVYLWMHRLRGGMSMIKNLMRRYFTVGEKVDDIAAGNFNVLHQLEGLLSDALAAWWIVCGIRSPQSDVADTEREKEPFGLRPYHFTYPERRLTMEEMLNKFIDEGRREQEEMRAFIHEFRMTNELLFKERNNSLSELRFEVQGLLRVINNTPISNLEVKGVTTRGGKITTHDVQDNDTKMHTKEPLLPLKEKDLGSFTIPCDTSQLHINNVLADLGTSISLMPFTMYEKLGLGEPKATRMSLELADRSIQYLRGIVENVLIKVDKFVLPIDFVILDMPEDSRVPIILGRPFLATARAMMDVFNKKITLRVGDDEVIFVIDQSIKRSPAEDDECYGVDDLDDGNQYGISKLSICLIMEYLVNISKRHAFWSLNEDILKINDSDDQYAISIKDDKAYLCLHSPKTKKE
ncbi:DNA-directed DNA polymerase [Tanacetum coccineum]